MQSVERNYYILDRKPKLHIPSTKNTQINLVPIGFGLIGLSSVRAVLKISAILLKYAALNGFFFVLSWVKPIQN